LLTLLQNSTAAVDDTDFITSTQPQATTDDE